MTTTINISLPKTLYIDAKKVAAKQNYASFSEFVREQIRQAIYKMQGLTKNGFTPEFEERVLKAAKEPVGNSIEWDGVTPFTEFVLSHPPKGVKVKRNDKDSIPVSFGEISMS